MAEKRILSVNHTNPGEMWLDYILLPYGEFYQKTKGALDLRKGDLVRMFNGPDRAVESVSLIDQDNMCDFLCKMRYGISWKAAFEKWSRYAVLEGNAKDILSTKKCILIILQK